MLETRTHIPTAVIRKIDPAHQQPVLQRTNVHGILASVVVVAERTEVVGAANFVSTHLP